MNQAETITGLSLSQWEVIKPSDPSQYYDGDAIIEAYFKGKADGLAQQDKLSFNQFSENFELAQKHVIEALNQLEKHNVTPLGAYLKFRSLFSFKAILLVKEEDFVETSFLENYDFVRDFESRIKTEFYTLKISFLNGVPDALDEDLMSDNYKIKFTPVDEAEARRA
jgi:hypothetical protein